MSSQGSLRKRKDASTLAKAKESSVVGVSEPIKQELDALVEANVAARKRPEWDFRLALTVITGLAFLTRFWGISHPNEVVFDEVHFGKVSSSFLFIHCRSDTRTVRFVLPRTNILFRCSSTLRKTLICLDGMVRGI